MKKNIIFRVDFSSKIGLGHLMRCLVLAKEFKGANIYFICLHVSDGSLVTNLGYELINLVTNDIDEFNLHVRKIKPNLVIIDSYDITYEDEKKVKENCSCKLMVLDDNYNKHYCDMLLNHNIYAKDKHYKGKVPPFCKLRCGKKFTLIRGEFKKEKLKKREKNGILVALGGSDAKNLTQKVLEKLPKSVDIKVITTSTNKHLDTLIPYVQEHDNIKLYVNTKKMAKHMNKSKFAIITPSVTAHEALFLNLPFLAIKTAENQKNMYKYLKNQGIMCIKNLDDLNVDEIRKFL